LRHYEGLTAQAGRAWHCHVVQGANHAFYSTTWEREVIEATLGWVKEACPAASAGARVLCA
jgi:hypothetical protein